PRTLRSGSSWARPSTRSSGPITATAWKAASSPCRRSSSAPRAAGSPPAPRPDGGGVDGAGGGGGTTDRVAGHPHIGYLRGHADDEREVGEVPVVGFLLPARKRQSAAVV